MYLSENCTRHRRASLVVRDSPLLFRIFPLDVMFNLEPSRPRDTVHLTKFRTRPHVRIAKSSFDSSMSSATIAVAALVVEAARKRTSRSQLSSFAQLPSPALPFFRYLRHPFCAATKAPTRPLYRATCARADPSKLKLVKRPFAIMVSRYPR